MDAAVAGALCHQKHLQVLTREGSPHFLRDLEGVSAGQARTVIVLQPDTAKANPPSSHAATHRTVCCWNCCADGRECSSAARTAART